MIVGTIPWSRLTAEIPSATIVGLKIGLQEVELQTAVRQAAESGTKNLNHYAGGASMLWWTLRKLKSESHKTRREAVWKLVETTDERVVDHLLVALTDRYWGVREAAAQALGKIGDKRAIKPLITKLKDEDREVRRASAKALEQFDSPEAYQAISEFKVEEERIAQQERKAEQERKAKEEAALPAKLGPDRAGLVTAVAKM